MTSPPQNVPKALVQQQPGATVFSKQARKKDQMAAPASGTASAPPQAGIPGSAHVASRAAVSGLSLPVVLSVTHLSCMRANHNREGGLALLLRPMLAALVGAAVFVTLRCTLLTAETDSASQCQAFHGQCFFRRKAPATFPALPSVSFDI
jgi:hypothetical protein